MNLNGTYRGFAPTDESGVAMGELEMVIDDQSLRFRFATGLTIEEDEGPCSDLRELSPEEMVDLFEDGTDVSTMRCYQYGEDGLILVFAASDDDVPVTILRMFGAEIDAIFGPTLVFTPEQVAAGKFDAAVTDIEEEQGDPGVIPRLTNNGLRG